MMSAAETTIDDLVEEFRFLDDWEDRYRYVIELGRTLPELTPAEHSDVTKVRGCASHVWLVSEVVANGEKRLFFRGDSDALIVRGLVAIVIALFDGKSPEEVKATDAEAVFARLDLRSHLTMQRSNGLRALVDRIKADAEASLSASQA